MKTQREDLEYGFASEDKNISTISNYLKVNMTKLGGNSIFDFHNNNTIYAELKTRRVAHDTYPTALIGKNKCEWADKNAGEGKKFFFFFSYNDGVYGIEYTKEAFASFKVEEGYTRSYRLGCSNAPQRVVHIPVERLIKVA